MMKRQMGLVLALMLLGGCASTGDIANPFVRRTTWFSYVNGDDLRAGCQAGAPSRLRAVYNGAYPDQLRVYETFLDPLATGSGKTVAAYATVRVFPAGASLSSLTIQNPGSLLDPWRGQQTSVPLSADQVQALRTALDRDGLGEAASEGQTLDSRTPYWVVSGCLDGQVVFNAFRWPSPRFKALTFDDVLVSWFPEVGPLPVYRRAQRGTPQHDRRERYRFLLRVGPTGLRDTGLFAPPQP